MVFGKILNGDLVGDFGGVEEDGGGGIFLLLSWPRSLALCESLGLRLEYFQPHVTCE